MTDEEILLDQWHEDPPPEPEDEPTRFQVMMAGAWWENRLPFEPDEEDEEC